MHAEREPTTTVHSREIHGDARAPSSRKLRRHGTYLHHGAVDVGRAHDLVVRDQLVLVHGSEDVAAGDGLLNTRHGTYIHVVENQPHVDSNFAVSHQVRRRPWTRPWKKRAWKKRAWDGSKGKHSFGERLVEHAIY